MFGIEERQRLKDVLISAAQLDEQISAAALTGSAASGAEDRWSDIDLALGLVPEADLALVLAEWTEAMYRDHGAVHHTDLRRGGTIYRVFLLANTLQVDIAFSRAAEFGAIGPSFRLLFGTAQEQKQAWDPAAVDLVGMGWLYALHARSSIARGKVWQAEYMISGVRDHVLALACLRHGVPASQGRGMDQLPPEITTPLAAALVRSLDAAELARAFRTVVEALLTEIREVEPDLATRLTDPLMQLTA
jgi:hypothetical protein